MLSIVMGPGTRLASALLQIGDVRQQSLLVVPDQAEADLVVSRYPQQRVFGAWEDEGRLPGGQGGVHVYCCALGPIHPGEPRPAEDAAAMDRDIRLAERLAACYEKEPFHLVFVSSVLALSPRPARVYYAGWKCVGEAALAEILGRRPGACLSVLYPGRLVEDDRAGRVGRRLHTCYSGLAALMHAVACRGRPVRRIVGLDARLLMAGRGLTAWAAAVSGRR